MKKEKCTRCRKSCGGKQPEAIDGLCVGCWRIVRKPGAMAQMANFIAEAKPYVPVYASYGDIEDGGGIHSDNYSEESFP